MKLFIDGGCSGNDQKDMRKRRMISVVADERNNILIEEKSRGGSNNIAEFIALYEAIKYCVENKIENVEIITDSKNNLSWFNGQLKKRKQNNFKWILSIRNQIDRIRKQVNINLIWRPREENLAGQYIESKFKL